MLMDGDDEDSIPDEEVDQYLANEQKIMIGQPLDALPYNIGMMSEPKLPRTYDSSNRGGPRGPYGNGMSYHPQFMIIKKENGEDTTIILPFRTRRIERNNNNGVRKQARLEIRKRMINERVKLRARI